MFRAYAPFGAIRIREIPFARREIPVGVPGAEWEELEVEQVGRLDEQDVAGRYELESPRISRCSRLTRQRASAVGIVTFAWASRTSVPTGGTPGHPVLVPIGT